jgi:hypothetical protein
LPAGGGVFSEVPPLFFSRARRRLPGASFRALMADVTAASVARMSDVAADGLRRRVRSGAAPQHRGLLRLPEPSEPFPVRPAAERGRGQAAEA